VTGDHQLVIRIKDEHVFQNLLLVQRLVDETRTVQHSPVHASFVARQNSRSPNSTRLLVAEEASYTD
jgi:hypothetical protein